MKDLNLYYKEESNFTLKIKSKKDYDLMGFITSRDDIILKTVLSVI